MVLVQLTKLGLIASVSVMISLVVLLPFLWFDVLRQRLMALTRMKEIIVVILLSNLSNAFLNWVFVYGHLGSPAMGAPGSAWATVVSRWLMFLLLFALGARSLYHAIVPWRAESLHVAPLLSMLRLGLPIRLQQLLEFGLFGSIGVLMGILV